MATKEDHSLSTHLVCVCVGGDQPENAGEMVTSIPSQEYGRHGRELVRELLVGRGRDVVVDTDPTAAP